MIDRLRLPLAFQGFSVGRRTGSFPDYQFRLDRVFVMQFGAGTVNPL